MKVLVKFLGQCGLLLTQCEEGDTSPPVAPMSSAILPPRFIIIFVVAILTCFNASVALAGAPPYYWTETASVCIGNTVGATEGELATRLLAKINAVATPCGQPNTICNGARMGEGPWTIVEGSAQGGELTFKNTCTGRIGPVGSYWPECPSSDPDWYSCGTDVVKNYGQPESCVGNPVNVGTGNKFQAEYDYGAAGNSSLEFNRYYNKGAATDFAFSNGSGLGSGWRGQYDRAIRQASASAYMIRHDGKVIVFTLFGTAWTSDSDINDRLVALTNSSGVLTGWRYTTSYDSVETYDAEGKLASIKDRSGVTQTLTYSCRTVNTTCPVATPTTVAPYPGLLIKVSDSFGRSLSFTYNTAGQLVTLTDPALNITRYTYDGFYGNLTSVTYPDSTPADLTNNPQKTYVYGELANTSNASQPHALTGIIDENGIRYATYQYDDNGKAISTEHAVGVEKYNLAFSPDGSTTTVTDPLGSVRTTNFTTILGVVKPTSNSQPAGSGCNATTSAMTYDANGNVASRTDFNGNRTNYTYDLTSNLETSRTEGLTATGATTPQTRTTTTEWHPTFRLPINITEPGLETTVSYDSKGHITHKSLKDLVTAKTQDWNTTYTYAPSGILLQKVEDGPRTDVSDLSTVDYYPEDAVCTGGHLGCRGQLKQVTNALGHVTRITRYSANGQPEVVIDPNGLTTTMAYDVRQHLISLDVGGELTTYRYDPAGLMTQVSQPNGATLAYRYDNAHRLIEAKDQLGNTRSYTLDAMGNRIKEDLTDPNGQLARSQSRVYDALSRLQNLVYPQ